MDIGQLKLFHMMKERMDWLGQRQKVIAQNVANADTNGYEAQDLKPLNFERLVKKQSEKNDMRLHATASGHLTGTRTEAPYRFARNQKAYEITPTGNAVTLEDQLMKMSGNADDYRLTTQMYKKYSNMFKVAAGSPR